MSRATTIGACVVLLTGTVAFLATPRAVAATPTAANVLEQADSAYQAHDWAKARALYEQLTREQPKSSLFWLRLGVSLQASGDHKRALAAYANAQKNGLPPMTAQYRIAIVWASQGESDKALEALAEAVKQGFSVPDSLTGDADWRVLRADKRFEPLVEKAKRNRTPCAYASEYQQFDFWLGDWDVVTTTERTPAGVSHIERVIDDCVIWENWRSLGDSGYFGKSYNIYNPDYKRWEQFWVDNAGMVIHFYGGLVDGVMDYYTEVVPQTGGTTLKRRLQFFNLGPDKVRQFGQRSTDEGKTWSVEYDFTYNRHK